MTDEQKSALRIRAAAEELSVASSLDTKAAILDSATISATKLRRSQLERDFDRRNRWRSDPLEPDPDLLERLQD